MSTIVPPTRSSPASGPDLLRRTTTIPSTGTRIARSLRHQCPLRKEGRAPHAVTNSAATLESAPEDITPDEAQEEVVAAAFLRPALDTEDRLRFEYDTIESYDTGPTGPDARDLVKKEAERLVGNIHALDAPLVLQQCQRLGKGDLTGYTGLTILAQTLITVRLICQADNYGIAFVNGLEGFTKERYYELLRRVHNSREELGLASNYQIKQEIWSTPDKFAEDAEVLVDLVTGYIAKYLVQVAHGKGWRNHQLGALAKFTAKAKALLRSEINKSVDVALSNAYKVLDNLHERPTTDDQENMTRRSHHRGKLVRTKIDVFQTDRDRILEYLEMQERDRRGILRLLDYVFMSFLPGDRHPGFYMTEYEICGVVMETGFHDFKTLLFQDRDFEYASSSDADHLNYSRSAFRMLDKLGDHFIREHNARPPSSDRLFPGAVTSETITTLEWHYPQSTSQASSQPVMETRTCKLVTMTEIISIMIPLALASPVVSATYKNLVETFYLALDPGEVVRPFPDRPFNAFARLYTNKFEAARQPRLQGDVLQLADAVTSGLFSRTSLLDDSVCGNTMTGGGGDGNPRFGVMEEERREKRSKKLGEAHELMDTWVYAEDAVVVPCGLYVWLVISGASVLVAGGLAIGLSIQDRITGVDPFNITMYAWALAALVLLICKARLVEEWSWNDFLHGRVKCRSVSELHAVTGIHEQLILAKLLHDEHGSILRTRGPFNAAFLNKSDAGFSIDVPLKNKTMLLSGLVLIKVEIALGYALVCLDVRRGTELRTVNHREVNSNTPRLICPRMDRLAPAALSKAHGEEPSRQLRFPLKMGALEWRRVEGIYNVLDAEFI
ncbi:hypothetical protein VTJ49DRAFT_7742 [Mycothermus thermophilus]|uniref:Uncharacterized protein n=1 Tax=Humicola insolens TaxID=85995 RepID=A0ABR3VGG7_HUMIN